MLWIIVMRDPALRSSRLALPFTLLLVAHALLHSRVERVRGTLPAIAYLLVQTGLALALVVIAGQRHPVDLLWFPLAGEAVGLWAAWWPRLIALLALGLAAAAGLLLTDRADLLPAFLLSAGVALPVVGVYVITYLRQLRERERAEALLTELQTAHGQLRAYAARVEELTVTQERQRMARELHDTLAQGVAGLIMQLEAVESLLARDETGRAREVVGRALVRARSTLADARASIQALRSPLERGDLVEAIRRQLEALQEDTGIHSTLEAGPGELKLGESVAGHLLRVVQEGLANVSRHARAGTVAVRVWTEAGQVHLQISDDGIGFDPAAARPPGHFGLIGLGERITLAGGTLHLDSAPGQGTRLSVALPADPTVPGPLPAEEASAHGR